MSEIFFYMTTKGRVSGNPHSIEIWFTEVNGCYYICSEFPDKSDWVKNIRKTPQVQFHLGEPGQQVPEKAGIAEVVEDETELELVKARFRAKYDWDAGLFVRICPA
jgi:general stress protein 26